MEAINARVKLEWHEIDDFVADTFRFWTERLEKDWFRQAWTALDRAGLTRYDGVFEFYKVKVRLLIIATLYCEFCYQAWREDFLDGTGSLQIWIGQFEFTPFVVGQMVGQEFESDESECELLTEGVQVLIRLEREAVIQALFQHMGGESGLFVKLWTAGPGIHEVEDTPAEEVEWTVLNDSGDADKQEGYMWISQGMPSVF